MMQMSQPPDDAELARLVAEATAKAEERKKLRAADYFKPHPEQRRFLNAGLKFRERLLMAANRSGKTHTGAFEAACHLTGEYPSWWEGRRFDVPTKGWICGETSLAVRDICQAKLCGEPGVESSFGSGMIPKTVFAEKPSLSRGVTDAYDTIQVRHSSGGISIARFKSYEQGRSKFVGEGLDWIWFDEEPSPDIYSEGLTRLGERNGIAWLTFTPLDGPTDVVLRFTDEPSVDRTLISMTIDDALHIPPAVRQTMIAGYLPHEREARSRGIPMYGSGRIFTTPEESVAEARIPDRAIPPHWFALWGIDIGIGHPFAAVLLLWDREYDVIHVHRTIRMSDATPIVHAAAMKKIALQVPVAWPKDAGDRDRGSGEPVASIYKREGLRMLGEHAKWPDGSISTDAGIMEWDLREKSGRLKVARDLTDWFEERRIYHCKDGKIVKIKDDLLSATRVGLMMKRYAKQVQLGPLPDAQRTNPATHFARGSPNHPEGGYDLFGV
jgi:phage terminase large subunit-like protein